MLRNLKYLSPLVIVSVLFLFSLEVKAQKTKPSIFYRDSVYNFMFTSYQTGDLQQIIDIFKENCLAAGDYQKEKESFKVVKSRIKADIYELVVKAYLALDMHLPAEFFMRKLFAIRYDDDFNDYWLAIRNAHENTFYIAPNVLVGIYGGVNGSLANSDKKYAILEPLSQNVGETYTRTYHNIDEWFSRSSMIGWHLGLHGEYGITKNISTNFRLQYNSYKLGYDAINSWRNL